MMPAVEARSGTWRSRVASALRGRTGDTAWALVDQGTGLAAAITSFLLLGRTLGATGYGAFVGLYSLIGPFSALTQAGVFLAAMEHVVREKEDPVDVARSSLSITALNALVSVPILTALALHWIGGLPALAAFLLVATEFCLYGAVTTSAGMIQALSGFPAATRVRITGALAKVGLLTLLAATGSLTLTSLAIGQVFTLGAVALLALTRVSRLIGGAARPGAIRMRHVRSALLYGVGISASMAQNDGDKFVLNAAHHQADAGRYGAAYRLMGVALLPVSALASATHLSFLDADSARSSQLRRAIRLSVVALAYAVPAVGALVLLAPLVPAILSRDFSQTTQILQLLAPVVVLRGVGVFPMNGLMGLGLNALRTKLLVGNALLSLALYAATIPRYSWRGALAATLVSEVLLCASAWVALVVCERSRLGAARTGLTAPAP